MALRLGLGLPQRGGVNLRTDIVDVARAAEVAGFSSLWVYERLLFPAQPSDGPLGVPGSERPTFYQECADPLSVLAVAAVVTDSVRLGVNVLTAALRMPVHLAKALATIDRLSGGGRLIAGFGAGWSDDELQDVGSTSAERVSRLDEALDVLQAAWGDDPVSYYGQWFQLDRSLIQPKPLAQIPVLLDGAGATYPSRIVRRANGWLLVGGYPETVGGPWAGMGPGVAQEGRQTPARETAMEKVCRAPVQITAQPAGPDRLLFVGSVQQIVEDIWVCRESGVTEVIVELQFHNAPGRTGAMIETALDIRELAAVEGLLADEL